MAADHRCFGKFAAEAVKGGIAVVNISPERSEYQKWINLLPGASSMYRFIPNLLLTVCEHLPAVAIEVFVVASLF